jgi:DNA polymerase-3 subunit epsilon
MCKNCTVETEMDTGVIVDLETTGLDPEKDKIIEIGMLEFAVDSDYSVVILNAYSALEDPGFGLEPEIEKLTGLSNRHLEGRAIDWKNVQSIFGRNAIVIAHNMPFDRGFLKKRPELDLNAVHWGCSAKHIDWNAHGFKTRALNYLAADHGFVNSFAHRALFDCATTLRLIGPYLAELIETSYEREIKFLATGAAFETKDILRDHGYRWDQTQRVWQKVVFEKNLEAERQFLTTEVYRGNSRHEEIIVSADA